MTDVSQNNLAAVPPHLELTACDHEQNGYVGLALWMADTLDDAMAAVARVNAMCPEEAQPDPKTEPFSFILDVHTGENGLCFDHIDDSVSLPMQIAMRLAPDQVRAWLQTRPQPGADDRYPPTLGRAGDIAALQEATDG
jgi:hypothetical protein